MTSLSSQGEMQRPTDIFDPSEVKLLQLCFVATAGPGFLQSSSAAPLSHWKGLTVLLWASGDGSVHKSERESS